MLQCYSVTVFRSCSARVTSVLRCYGVTVFRPCSARVTVLQCYGVTPLLCCYSVTALRCDVYIRGELNAHVSSFEYKEYKEKEEYRRLHKMSRRQDTPPRAPTDECQKQMTMTTNSFWINLCKLMNNRNIYCDGMNYDYPKNNIPLIALNYILVPADIFN